MLTLFLGIPLLGNKRGSQDAKAIAIVFWALMDVILILILTKNI
jgi:hypothetical protein